MTEPHEGGVKPALSRARDRQATERLILAAAKSVLSEEGFRGFGINAIARRAGCDKQLVYRYFGGLDGLVDAIGADLGDWIEGHLAPPVGDIAPLSYAALIEGLMLRFLAALRADPLVQKIAAWEMSDTSPHVRRLSQARARALASFVATAKGPLTAPTGVDANAINAILVAAIQHLVLSASASGQFAGLDLVTDSDWERLRDALRRIIAVTLC